MLSLSDALVTKSGKEVSVTQRFWWLNLVRGIVALIIGILILGWPQTARDLFVNFLAMYWLTSGLASVQWSLSTHQNNRWWLVEGLLEIVIGAALLLRPVYGHNLAPGLAIRSFGLVAFLVGLAQILSGYRIRGMTREQSLGTLLLGLFEMGLGLLLIFLNELAPLIKLLAGGWAFVGGALLILQSLQLRRVKATRF